MMNATYVLCFVNFILGFAVGYNFGFLWGAFAAVTFAIASTLLCHALGWL
jgi:hypothetical protein